MRARHLLVRFDGLSAAVARFGLAVFIGEGRPFDVGSVGIVWLVHD
jgi:hypothetical protein